MIGVGDAGALLIGSSDITAGSAATLLSATHYTCEPHLGLLRTVDYSCRRGSGIDNGSFTATTWQVASRVFWGH